MRIWKAKKKNTKRIIAENKKYNAIQYLCRPKQEFEQEHIDLEKTSTKNQEILEPRLKLKPYWEVFFTIFF